MNEILVAIYVISVLFTYLMFIYKQWQHNDITVKDLLFTFIMSVVPILNIIILIDFMGLTNKVVLKKAQK